MTITTPHGRCYFCNEVKPIMGQRNCAPDAASGGTMKPCCQQCMPKVFSESDWNDALSSAISKISSVEKRHEHTPGEDVAYLRGRAEAINICEELKRKPS